MYMYTRREQDWGRQNVSKAFVMVKHRDVIYRKKPARHVEVAVEVVAEVRASVHLPADSSSMG